MEENLPKFENREELVVNSDMAIDLRKAMSWAKFLSIMMFIGTGMMFLLSIVCFAVDPSTWFDNDMEPGAGGILGGVYLAVTVIYFSFPTSCICSRSRLNEPLPTETKRRSAAVSGT